MRMVCPDCAAGYEVPERLLAGRKTVRCARCGGSWPATAAAPAPLAAVPPLMAGAPIAQPVVPDSAPLEALAGPVLEDRRLRAAWIASVSAVALAVLALLIFHRAAAAGWPPLQRFYAAIGLG